MKRRALFAVLAALPLALLARDRSERRPEALTVHTGPARDTPWYPGKPRIKPPDWIYENGLTPAEHAIAIRHPCACSKPLDEEIHIVPDIYQRRRKNPRATAR